MKKLIFVIIIVFIIIALYFNVSYSNETMLQLFDEYLIEKEINSIRENLEHSIEDEMCLSDIFNSLVEKIIVNKDEDNPKKIKLDIIFKTGTTLKASSNNLGKKYHLEEYLTTSNSSICGN